MSTDDHNNIPTECLGVTGEVNFIKPNEKEILLTHELELAIENLNIFENTEETHKRREALIDLQDLCNEWISKKSIDLFYQEKNCKSKIQGKIFTFGSYRLGVNFSGADIDSLLIVPKFITRDEFFDEFVPYLLKSSSVQEMHAVPKAFVPVLKMKFGGVEIDLLFATVDLTTIPSDFSLSLNSDQLLRNMDDRDVRSVNGVRVTDDILRLVHDKNNFRSALKIIRIWAKHRCIYSNAMGFLGGVSWAILVARICQLWPMASVYNIVSNFFMFFGSRWHWPNPVKLKEVEDSSVLNLTQWDPRVNPLDLNHVMPILTPSYPSQNSTYNVLESHKRFIVDQMQKASKILQLIVKKEKSFEDLFKPLFFFYYRHYLVVTFRSGDKKQFREDSSLIESKLRLLIQYLESNMNVEFALLYLRHYDQIESSNGNEEGEDCFVRRWFIGLEFRKVSKILCFADEISRFKNIVKVDVDVSYSRRRDLFAFLSQEEFKTIRDKMRVFNSCRRLKTVNPEFQKAFDPVLFFNCRHYLVITHHGVNKNLFHENSILIDSEMASLVELIQSNELVESALLFLRSFVKIEEKEGKKSLVRRRFIAFKFRKIGKSLNLANEINQFKNLVKVDVDVTYSRFTDISSFLPAEIFTKICGSLPSVDSRKRNIANDSTTDEESVTTKTLFVNKKIRLEDIE